MKHFVAVFKILILASWIAIAGALTVVAIEAYYAESPETFSVRDGVLAGLVILGLGICSVLVAIFDVVRRIEKRLEKTDDRTADRA